MIVPVPTALRAGPAKARLRSRIARFAGLVLLALLPVAEAFAQPTGLPLPRFASTRSDPINVRVGPGTRYEIAFTYLRAGMPVEITQEFDTWRRIRDVDGDEGWVHQNLLTGARNGYVAPWLTEGTVPLRAAADANAAPRAHLGPKYPISIRECDGTWCSATATSRPQGGRAVTYSGHIEQAMVWGVYPDEVFD